MDRSERQALTAMFEGVDMVIARPEPTVLVVARGIAELREDPYRYLPR